MIEGGESPFDWSVLAPFIHPMKVAIVEALWRMDRPLSATDLTKLLGRQFSLSNISYHLTQLAKRDVVKKVRERRVRAATETFYFFSHLTPPSRR